jgi:hypothetical protein
MQTDAHKLMKAVTEFIKALPESRKAELRRALVRNAAKTSKRRPT